MIRVLAKTCPNILLLDWNLYGSPALHTCRLLQKAYPQLKLVLLSANEDNRSEAEAAGVGFVYSGSEHDELIKALRVLLIDDLLQTKPA